MAVPRLEDLCCLESCTKLHSPELTRWNLVGLNQPCRSSHCNSFHWTNMEIYSGQSNVPPGSQHFPTAGVPSVTSTRFLAWAAILSAEHGGDAEPRLPVQPEWHKTFSYIKPRSTLLTADTCDGLFDQNYNCWPRCWCLNQMTGKVLIITHITKPFKAKSTSKVWGESLVS